MAEAVCYRIDTNGGPVIAQHALAYGFRCSARLLVLLDGNRCRHRCRTRPVLHWRPEHRHAHEADDRRPLSPLGGSILTTSAPRSATFAAPAATWKPTPTSAPTAARAPRPRPRPDSSTTTVPPASSTFPTRNAFPISACRSSSTSTTPRFGMTTSPIRATGRVTRSPTIRRSPVSRSAPRRSSPPPSSAAI